MTARSRPARPKSATNLPSSSDPSGDMDLVASPRAPQHLQADAVLVGPEVRDRCERRAHRPVRPPGSAPRPLRLPPRPASARSGSAPRHRRAATRHRAMSPAATMPSAAKRRSSQTTPLSMVSPESANQSVVGTTPMPTTTTSAATASPPSSSTTSPPRPPLGPCRQDPRPRCRRAGYPARPRRSADPRRATPCNAAKWAPINGPRTLRSGTSRASSTVTRHPRSATGGGDLGPDEPGADDHDPGLVHRRDGGAQCEGVVEGAQGEQTVALRQDPRCPGAGGAARRS